MSVDMKGRIISSCLSLFLKYGIKSITVDDISHHIGISKKTFYEYFVNKNDIIELIAKDFISKNQTENREIIEGNIDVIEKILKIYKRILSQFCTINPSFIFDIKKYHSDIYDLFVEHRDKELGHMITKLLNQGKKEGVFRDDINEQIIFRLHISRINSIIDGTLLPEKHISDPDFFKIMITNLIGISTIKGHELINEKINEF